MEVLVAYNRILSATIYPALCGMAICYAILIGTNHQPPLGKASKVTLAILSAVSFAWLSLIAADRVPISTFYSQVLARTVWLVALLVLASGIVRLILHGFHRKNP